MSGGGISVSDEQLAATEPSDDRTSWFVIGVDLIDNGGEYVQATALCAPTGQAVAASPSRAKARAQFERRLAAVSSTSPVAHASCTRARILGQSKCIARGQFCVHSRGANRDYHRYGLHCGKRGRNGRYPLVSC